MVFVLLTYNSDEIAKFTVRGVFSTRELAEEKFEEIRITTNHTHREINGFEIDNLVD